MAEAADIERLKATGLTDEAIAEIMAFDLVKYQTEAQRRAAEVSSKNAAALAAAQKAGISNMDYYVNPIGAGEIIPGMSADIMAGLGMYDPQYWAVMRTYGSESNKDDPNDVTERSTFAIDPNAQYRLVDNKTGKVLNTAADPAGIKSLVDAANQLSATQGKKANWDIQKGETLYDPGGVPRTSWTGVAADDPDTIPLGIKAIATAMSLVVPTGIGQVAQAANIGRAATVGAQALGGGALAGIQGKDPITGALTAGLTSAGSQYLGPVIQSEKGLGKVATNLGSALGSGAGSFTAGIATGKSFENSLLQGATAAAQAYVMGELTKGNLSEAERLANQYTELGLMKPGDLDAMLYDFANADFLGSDAGIGGGGGGDGGILVTGPGTTGGGNAGATVGIGGADKTIIATAPKTEGDTTTKNDVTYVPPGSNIDVTAKVPDTTTKNDVPYVPPGSNIDVTAKVPDTTTKNDVPYVPPGSEIIVRAPPQPPVAPPIVIPPTFEPPPTTPPKKKWTWKDWVRLGLLAPTAIKGLGELIKGGDTQTIIPDRSAVTYTPLNRQRGVGTFDPFTYGQAGPGYQTAEFEYFKPYTEPKVTQTNVPFSVQTVAGTPTYQYTPEQVEAKNAEAMNTYNQNVAKFNAYQDTLAQQVEAGTITLDDAIAQANTFGAGIGGIAPVPAADGGYIGYADGGEADDDMVSHLIEYRKGGGHDGPGRVKGVGSGQDDKIPAWLSDGEYVWSAQDVADLGDGSTDEGVRRLDRMRQMVRKQAGRKDVKKIAKPQKGIDHMLKSVGGVV